MVIERMFVYNGSMAATTTLPETDEQSAADVLSLIGAARREENAASARQLELAARWADLHPVESIHHAAVFTTPGSEHEEPVAGAGCPLVAEFSLAELGAVLGVSTTAAARLVGHALELRHRLPRLWAKVHAGRVPAWRARSVAEATIHATPVLSREAAGWIDSQVAAVAGKIGPAQLDRLVAEAIRRHHLADEAPFDPDGWLEVDPRHATLHRDQAHFAGTLHFEAELDIAAALDLDQALSHGAAALAALGSAASLDARRSVALGDLARHQTAFDLQGPHPPTPTPLPAAREVSLHLHFGASAGSDGLAITSTGRLEAGQRLVLLEQIKGWCGDSHTRVTIRPVIDLSATLSAAGYAIPDRLREQVVLRDTTCMFAWCSRPARGCDIDHVVPFDHDAHADGREQPGPTSSTNLIALCRRHHRIKTHGRWRVERPDEAEPVAVIWTSPHGHRYRRDPGGTTALDPPPQVPHQRRP